MKSIVYKIFVFILLSRGLCFADVYVSPTGNDGGSGTIGDPLLTIQAGIMALKTQGPNNTLYLRGGTYTTIPTDGTTRAIKYSTLNNATSWDNAYTIRSYPGEWAVIDAASYSDARIFVLSGGDLSGGIGFIEISHLEIKNAHGRTHCAAIDVRGGPFRFKYLYIHDNVCDIANNNPSGLHLTNGTGLTDIEYNILYRNGYIGANAENSSNIAIYSDYIDGWGTQALTNASGFSTARHSNNIRYNYIDGGGGTSIGIKHKYRQYLENNTDFEGPIVDVNNWKDKGDNYHHNIIVGHTMNGMYLASDFNQIYNNILDGSDSATYSVLQVGSSPVDGRPQSDTVVYNNTVKNSNRGVVYTAVSDAYPVFYNRIYNYNNIMDGSLDASGYRDISFMLLYDEALTWDINSLCQVKNNLFYNPDNAIFFRILTVDGSYHNQSPWAINNLSRPYSEADYLYAGTTGANAYKLNPAYTDYTTVSTGGYGSAHPYLSGITIPSYIGAVNPSDDAWVDGVLAMDVAFFMDAEGDPLWIEGAAPVVADPVVEILTASGQTTTASIFTVTGTATADTGQIISGVTCSGQTVSPDDGTWDEQTEAFTCLANLALGENTLVFIGSDGTRTGSDSLTVTRIKKTSKINGSATIKNATIHQ